MASEYWGVNQGDQAESVVVQGSSPSKNVELKVDLAAGMTRNEVMIAIEEIQQAIMKGNWPPA